MRYLVGVHGASLRAKHRGDLERLRAFRHIRRTGLVEEPLPGNRVVLFGIPVQFVQVNVRHLVADVGAKAAKHRAGGSGKDALRPHRSREGGKKVNERRHIVNQGLDIVRVEDGVDESLEGRLHRVELAFQGLHVDFLLLVDCAEGVLGRLQLLVVHL